MEIEPIAKIYTDFPEKFGIPRQSGLAETIGRIVFEEEYRITESVRGLDEYSHIWLIWQFSEAVRDTWSPTVRPPRLGGNKRVGVFATRSPFRPNSLGLSSVKLIKTDLSCREAPVIYVSGADLMDGTPIYDIKPYLAYTDSHQDAVCGFADEALGYRLNAVIPDSELTKVPEEKREALIQILENDPRPGYQNDPDRIYKMSVMGFDIKFKVKGKEIMAEKIN